MRKRLIASVVLIFTALVTGIFSCVYFDDVCTEMLSSSEKICKNALSGESCGEEFSRLYELWDKNSFVFYILLKNPDADSVYLHLERLDTAVKCRDEEKICEEASELYALLEVIKKGELPEGENIF